MQCQWWQIDSSPVRFFCFNPDKPVLKYQNKANSDNSVQIRFHYRSYLGTCSLKRSYKLPFTGAFSICRLGGWACT